MKKAVDHWKAHSIDLSRLLAPIALRMVSRVYNCEKQNHRLERALDNDLIARAKDAIENDAGRFI